MIQRWVTGLLTIGVLCVSGHALADEPATANVFQLAAGFRYGFEMNEGDLNPWGAGLGIAAGYTLPNAVYLGGNFDYFFGDSQDNALGSVSANEIQLMAEGGYDFGAGRFVIRPKLGAGLAWSHVKVCLDLGAGEDCQSDTPTDFALAPGATLMYIGPSVSLSLDLRYALIFADETGKALIFSAGIGF